MEADADAITGTDADGDEAIAEAIGEGVELGVGEGLVDGFVDGGAVGEFGGGLFEILVEGDHDRCGWRLAFGADEFGDVGDGVEMFGIGFVGVDLDVETLFEKGDEF